MKVLTVVGARPQFIKVAAVSRYLRAEPGVTEVLAHTGQHYDDNMSRVFFDELEIPQPDISLDVGSGTHGVQTGAMLAALDGVLLRQDPDWVLVYGDTNSTLAGAISASKLHFPVAHVEAGLRSYNRVMPEEINRVVADHLSELLFAPTQLAVENLEREGISGPTVRLTGDVMYDAALYYGEKAKRQSTVLDELGLTRNGFVLATVHRAENTDDPARLGVVFEALLEVARAVPVVLPMHPRTRKALGAAGLLARVEKGLSVVPPVGYLDMVNLEQSAVAIATDSGGVQKEAFFHRVPCVTLRDETEWVELVDLGWNRIAPPRSAGGLAALIREQIGNTGREAFPYGKGDAGRRIAAALAARAL